MAIKVKFYSTLKLALKSAGIEYEPETFLTIKQLLKRLDEDFDNRVSYKLLVEGKIDTGTIILVNGHNVLHREGLDTEVKDGDEIAIFPPSAGG
ncbi:MAG: MoaD family protein [Halanaerobiaceae bacterium]